MKTSSSPPDAGRGQPLGREQLVARAPRRRRALTASIARHASRRATAAACPSGPTQPSRFMRASVDSIDSTVRPFTFSLARSSSSALDAVLASLRSSRGDHVDRLGRRCRGACRRTCRPGPSRRTGSSTSRPSRRARASRAPPGTGARSVEPPRIVSSTRSAKRRSSPRAMPGRAERRGGTARSASGGSACAASPLAGAARARPFELPGQPSQACSTSSTSLSWSTLPAAASTRFDRHVAAVVVGRDVRHGHVRDHLGACR